MKPFNAMFCRMPLTCDLRQIASHFAELPASSLCNKGMRAPTYFLLAVLIPIAGQAQTFDVASIKPDRAGNAGGEGSTRESISHDPGALVMRNVTLRSCLRWAYGVANDRISGPAWIGADRYDIQARTEKPATEAQLRLMLQSLLASRFHLTIRRETKELPIYELLVAKDGPKLTPAHEEGQSQMRPGDGDLAYLRYSMPEFAEKLSGIPFRVDRPVVDKTGLSGAFNFKLKIAGDAAEMKSNFERSEGPDVAGVLRQIGLRLQPRRAPLESLIVESAEKNPSEN